MAATGDWVTPRLNGLKYFEKPPLQYWATAAAYQAFGVHEWTARLWPALAGFLAVLVDRLSPATRWAAPTLGAYAGARARRHAAGTRASRRSSRSIRGLAFFLALALCRLRHRPARRTRRGRRGAHGCGSPGRRWRARRLSQGPDRRRAARRRARRLHARSPATSRCGGGCTWRRASRCYLALTAPWFVAVARANDEFLRFFFVHEHFERFLTTEHQRAGPVVVLRAVVRRRHPAVADGAGVRRCAARGATATPDALRLLVAALRARLGGVRLPVLQRLGIEAAVVHPADVPAAGARHRLAAGAPATPRTLFRLMLPLVVVGDRADAGPRCVALRSLAPRFATARIAGGDPRRLRRRGSRRRAVVATAGGVAGARRLAAARRREPRRDCWGVALWRSSTLVAAADRGRRLRRLQPDALDLGYPAGGAARGALRRRRALLPGRDVRPDPAVLPRPHDDARRLPRRARARASTPSRRSRSRRSTAWIAEWRGSPQGYALMLAPELHATLAAAGRPDARARARPAPRRREPAMTRRPRSRS